ncbi:hypothetical protein EG866_15995, partial [Enterococcus faecalis]
RGEARDARRHVLGDVVADVELRPHVAEEGGGRALPEGRAAHGRRGVRDVDGVQVLAEPRAVEALKVGQVDVRHELAVGELEAAAVVGDVVPEDAHLGAVGAH